MRFRVEPQMRLSDGHSERWETCSESEADCYAVYDENDKFLKAFPTKPEAESYITELS